MKRVLVAAAVVSLAATLLVFAREGYPVPGGDAAGFLVSSINYRLGRGLVNPFYAQNEWSDPTGGQRHIYYPPLFSLAVSALMPRPTPVGAFLAVALMQGVALLLAAFLLWRVGAAGAREPSWPATLLLVISLAGLCTSTLPTHGRAEALAQVFLLLGALALALLRGGVLAAVLGVLVGLTAAAQPIGAVEMGLVIALVFSFRRTAREAAPALLAVALLALAVFALTLALTPFGLRETMSGIVRAYPHTPWSAPPGRDWWRPWILVRRATFYGPLLLLALAAGVALARRAGRRPAAPALFALAAALLALALYHGSLTHKSLRNYNAILLAPVAYALVLAWFVRAGRAARALCLLVVAATATGFAGYVVCFPWFRAHARGLAQARAEWATLELPPERRLLLLGNLWALSEDYARMDRDPRTLEDPGRPRPLLVLGQRREDGGRPPAVPGFVLVHDAFNPALAGAGWRRRFVDEDYSFAVYRPE